VDQNRTGTLFFQTAGWRPPDPPDAGVDGGVAPLMGCQAGGVSRVRLYLRRMGAQVLPAPITANLGNVHLDGMLADCHTPTGPSDSYQVPNLPWGPYEIVVGGYSDQGASQLMFCSATPLFVGQGTANPPFKITTDAAAGTSCP